MAKVTWAILSCICFAFISFSQSNGSIKGNIKLDETWKQKVFLSEISTFNDLYKMSNSMIISEVDIDSLNNFIFDLSNFSEEDKIYRLHVAKADSPDASLIIGGEEENFKFIIANKYSNFEVKSGNIKNTMSNVVFSNSIKNNSIQYIDLVLKSIDSIDYSNSQIKRSFILKAAQEKLRFIADTTSHSLVSLYAIYKSNFKNNLISHKDYYQDYLKKWENENSSYFKKFRKELSLESRGNNYNYIILVAAISFILGLIISKLIPSRSTNKNLKLLSIQERKIYKALKDGKSNKEISEEFNIGISTVKSHVSSIYSKLNIKSRKEILNL